MFAARDEAEIKDLRQRLSAAVAALDLGCCLPSAAAALVTEGDQIERLGRAIKTLAATVVADSAAWQTGGAASPEDWLAGTTGATKSEATETIKTGRRLKDLPTTAKAVREGKLSAKAANTVADAASTDPTAEQRLLDEAERGTLGSLRNEARRVKQAAERDPEGTRKRIHAQRSCRHWVDADGVGHLHASGPAEQIARLGARIGQRAGRFFDDARKAGRKEPLEAYAFDALEDLVTREGRGQSLPRGADAKIIVRVDHAALLRGQVVDGEVCEIAGIGPIPVSVAREWMEDAFVAALFTSGDEIQKVVHLGRRFTATQTTAMQWRDPECCVQRCTNTVRLEKDHFDRWADTHTTTFASSDRICPRHHDAKTAGWHLAEPDERGKRPLIPPDHPDHPLQQLAAAVAEARITRTRATGTDPPG